MENNKENLVAYWYKTKDDIRQECENNMQNWFNHPKDKQDDIIQELHDKASKEYKIVYKHTTNNICTAFKNCLGIYGNKYTNMTTDGGRNMVAGRDKLFPHGYGITCVIHTLHNGMHLLYLLLYIH